MSGIEVALGENVTEQEGGIMDGFKGKCKFTCFPCCIAWEGKSDEKDIECCPECGREAALIERIVDTWTPIGFHEKPYKVVLTARAGDLYPVAAFFLIDNHSGEKIWLREIEGPRGFELTDGGLELMDRAGRYTELYRAPTHYMEIPEMPAAPVVHGDL